jgi:hypothetical protein
MKGLIERDFVVVTRLMTNFTLFFLIMLGRFEIWLILVGEDGGASTLLCVLRLLIRICR